MQLIYLFTSLALLWLHLLGANLLLARYFPVYLPYAVTRALGVLLPVLLLFFIEHFCGLGRLQWIWPLSSLMAAAVIYVQREQLARKSWRRAEIAFALCFAWGLLWKLCFSAIYPTSERVTDLYFMQNYLTGVTLPAPDQWFAGYQFNFYYAFQHYGAALMARWFGWDSGFAYNLAFVLLTSLGLALAWEVVRMLLPALTRAQHASRLLLIAALALGGTGVAPFQRLIVTPDANARPDIQANDEMWASARFIGNYDVRANTAWGREWFLPRPEQKPTPDFQARELPLENFGYQFYMGDYHPPLGGYFLLFLALALLLHMQRKGAYDSASSAPSASAADAGIEARRQAVCQALLTFCLPLMLITNTWIVPMLALLIAAWLAWRYWQKQPPNWLALFAGGMLGMVLIYPFFSYFSAQTLQTPIRLVQAPDHTPVAGFLLTMWPLLLLFALAAGEVRREKLTPMLVGAFVLMLLAGEFLFVDDPSVARFERTNTTIKWWGWMWSGGLLTSGALALASSKAWRRRLAQLVLLAVAAYALPTAQYFMQGGAAFSARFNGKDWFVGDAPVGDTIEYLSHAERGIVLENWLGDSYTNQTLYALFSRQPALMGWPHHISLWHHGAETVWLRNAQVRDFYQGKMAQPVAWLLQNQVRYVVWGRPEAGQGEKWQELNQKLASHYAWHAFSELNQQKIGIWERRQEAVTPVSPVAPPSPVAATAPLTGPLAQ